MLFRCRLEPVKVGEESRILKMLLSKLKLEETSAFRVLALVSKVCMRVLAKLQNNFKETSLELDFLRYILFFSKDYRTIL